MQVQTLLANFRGVVNLEYPTGKATGGLTNFVMSFGGGDLGPTSILTG